MIRRPAARIAAAAGAALLLAGCRGRAPAHPPEASSVVVFCFDTVRADAFFRRDGGASDALTAWERRAVVYDHARAPAPWTLPSIASLVTGDYPARHGAGKFPGPVADLDEVVPSGIAPDVPTLGEIASRSGLAARAFVASPWADEATGVLRGFDRVDLLPTRRLCEAARRWIAARRPGRRFFLYVHWMDSHGDGTLAEQHALASELDPRDREALVAGAPADTCRIPGSAPCARYLAYHRGVALQRADAAALLSELERRGLLRETLVVLFADHGEEFGEHRFEERRRGTDPRGVYGVSHGHAMYEELLRVPLVVWSPGAAPRRDPRPVSLVDVAPTVVARLGLRVAAPMQGRLLPLAGETLPPRPFFASGIAYGPPQAAVLVGEEKEIAIDCPERQLHFDLGEDPAEKRPADGAGSRLPALLARYRADAGRSGSPIRLSSEKVAQLRSLGYLRHGGSGAAAAVPPRRPEGVGLYDPRTATFALYPAGGAGAPRFVRFGAAGDVPVVGDWDGDGVTDLGVFRPAAAVFELAKLASTIPVPPRVGAAPGDVPVGGDWDGDGVDTVAIYRPALRTLFWADANRADARWFEIHAAPEGIPVAGRWRCGGRSSLAFFTPDARFAFAEANVVFRPLPVGERGDLPVAGDWDGDGRVTVGVYRPATGEFVLRNSLAEGARDRVRALGRPGGIPVAGRWETEPAPRGGPRELR